MCHCLLGCTGEFVKCCGDTITFLYVERQGFGKRPAMRAFDEAVMSNLLQWGPNFELHKPDQ